MKPPPGNLRRDDARSAAYRLLLVRVHPLDPLVAFLHRRLDSTSSRTTTRDLGLHAPRMHGAPRTLVLSSSSFVSGDGAVKARAEAFDINGVVWMRLGYEAPVLIGRFTGPGEPVSFSPSSNTPPLPLCRRRLPYQHRRSGIEPNLTLAHPRVKPLREDAAASPTARGGPVEEVVVPLPIPIPDLQLDKLGAYVQTFRVGKGLDAAMEVVRGPWRSVGARRRVKCRDALRPSGR